MFWDHAPCLKTLAAFYCVLCTRWDVVQSSEGGEWEMVLTATQDVEAGYQLLLSYGERSNDDFFIHYG